jgi:hypothetical protein
MSMIGFPLLLIPLAIVNILAFLMPGVSLSAPIYAVPLSSGTSWSITIGDALIALGMLLLFFEVRKTMRPRGKYLTDHLLSFLVLAGAVAEFVMLPQFGNSTFFLLTVLAFVDFINAIAIRLRLRGVYATPRAEARTGQPARAEPTLTPAPAPQPAPVHEAVLDLDHPIDPAHTSGLGEPSAAAANTDHVADDQHSEPRV